MILQVLAGLHEGRRRLLDSLWRLGGRHVDHPVLLAGLTLQDLPDQGLSSMTGKWPSRSWAW
jgi:hypothetical protein